MANVVRQWRTDRIRSSIGSIIYTSCNIYTRPGDSVEVPGTVFALHDASWGLDFGDPQACFVAPVHQQADDGTWGWDEQGRCVTAAELEGQEHPMSLNGGESFVNALAEDPSMLSWTDESGWSLLHREALAGNLAPVKILLEHGVDTTFKNRHGATALDLARSMGWPWLVEALQAHET